MKAGERYRVTLTPPVLATGSARVHIRAVSSERNARLTLPLGLLAAMRAAVVALMLAAIIAPGITLAGKTTSSGSHKGSSKTIAPHKTITKPKTKRSLNAKHDFKHPHPSPSTGKSSRACPGYVIGHIKPLCAGGADSPSNMQWQTLTASKANDKLERQECSAFPRR